MKHIHHLVLLFLASALTGCGLYTPYSRPELDIPADSLYCSSDSSAIAPLPWQEFFADTCLQALISAGLQRNTDLEIARLQVEEASAVLQNARLSYLPSVVATSRNACDLNVVASWEVDVFARVTNAKRAARASLEQSQDYLQAVQTQLVASIAQLYCTLLMLDKQLEISAQAYESWTQTIDALEAMVLAGKSNDVAVLQARASRTALEASMQSLRQSSHETEDALCALLKEPYHAIRRGTLDDQVFPADFTDGVPLQLLAVRPDVRAAEAALAQAFYMTNSARAAFYPSLTLTGTLDVSQFLSTAIASITAPLFNQGTNIANLKVAKARQQEALLQFEQTLLDAGNEVNDALHELKTARSRIALGEQRVADLEDAVEKTKLLVMYTSSTYLEVLTAQQSLLDARLTLAQDRIEMMQSLISLYHALGGGVR